MCFDCVRCDLAKLCWLCAVFFLLSCGLVHSVLPPHKTLFMCDEIYTRMEIMWKTVVGDMMVCIKCKVSLRPYFVR